MDTPPCAPGFTQPGFLPTHSQWGAAWNRVQLEQRKLCAGISGIRESTELQGSFLNSSCLAQYWSCPVHQGSPVAQEAGDGCQGGPEDPTFIGGVWVEDSEPRSSWEKVGGVSGAESWEGRPGTGRGSSPCSVPPMWTPPATAPGQGGNASWGVCCHGEPCPNALTDTPMWAPVW